MNCDEALELLSGSLDGENTPAEEQQLQAHLAGCPSCRALLDAFREVDAAVAAPLPDPPDALYRGIMEAVAREPRRRKRRLWYRYGAVAAAAALVLVVGLSSLPQRPAAPAETPAAARELDTDDASSPGVSPAQFSVSPEAAAAVPETTADDAFPDGAPDLLVELIDDPAAPAGEVTALAQLTPEPTAVEEAVVYQSDVATVRQIITDCQDSYALVVPEDLSDAAADAPCSILVICPEE